MSRVFIFSTDEAVERFDDFQIDERKFVFHHLSGERPAVLIEGACWIFVDWMLPQLSGLEMCRRLRADPRTRDAHVTMVLEQDDGEARRRAMQAGADDYMLRPASRQAMLDRILAHDPAPGWRGTQDAIEVGKLTIHPAAERACYAGIVLPLSPHQFRLLRFMAENPNRVLSRQELIAALGQSGDPTDLRTVDVWIKRLRSALRGAGAEQLLRTVTNKGYVLDII